MVKMLYSVKDLLEEILTADQIAILDRIGYFTLPASTKYHLSVKGGLAQHSCNVTNRALQFNESMNLGLRRDWIILMGMLHDLVKTSYGYEPNYLKNGEISESRPYTATPRFDIGHGSASLYLAGVTVGIELPVPVASAIHHHMGFQFPRDTNAINTLQRNPIDMLCVLVLQWADQMATYVDEVEFK